MKFKIIGAGLTGLTIARIMQDAGHNVTVFEKGENIGGLCRDVKERKSGVWYNPHGVHIMHFRESDKEALSFIKKHVRLISYNHRVLMLGKGTFGYFPPNELSQELYNITNPRDSFFKEFIKSYSKKMWGLKWNIIKKKISNRFAFQNKRNYSFFGSEKVFVPENYTKLFENLSKGIKIKFGNRVDVTDYKLDKEKSIYIITSPIDEFFLNCYGKLSWRGIEIGNHLIKTNENILPEAVVNTNKHPKLLRMVEYNQLPHNRKSTGYSIISLEYPSKKENLCYPIPTKSNERKLNKYLELSKSYEDIYFVGRLGEYKYKNMNEAIADAIKFCEKFK